MQMELVQRKGKPNKIGVCKDSMLNNICKNVGGTKLFFYGDFPPVLPFRKVLYNFLKE